MRLLRRQSGIEYATISHVWADGLGNPTANALPACQVKRLRNVLKAPSDLGASWPGFFDVKYAINLYWSRGRPGQVFWMDTLCIPPGKEHYRLRQKCIDAMASTYASSYGVFVLDKALSSTDFEDSDAMYHIVCSVWMCRSWTLQEARLPERCLFEFANGVRELTGEKKSTDNADTEIHDKFICKFLDPDDSGPSHSGGRSIIWTRETNSLDLIQVWNWLAGRSTTTPEDLYVVLTSCLRFKLKQLNNFATPEEKWKSMLFSFPALPFFLVVRFRAEVSCP